MTASFRYRGLTLLVFCMYVFWGSFGIDQTLHPGTERFPLHRVFILLTAFVFLFNARQTLVACLKNKLLIALLFYVLLTAAWAYQASEAIKNFVFLASATLISIMAALAYADNRTVLIRRLFWLFFLMTMASAITALFFPGLGVNAIDFGKPRWVGITAHPNGLGTQGLTTIWLSANLFFLTKSKLEKQLVLTAIAAGFFAIIKADSMTSFVTSLAIVSYVCYCHLIGRFNFSVRLMFYFIAAIGFAIVVTFYMSTSEIANSALQSTGRNATFTGRSLLWHKAFMAIANNLFSGYGFDDLEPLSRKYHILMSHLHNGYIEILVKGGLIAATILISVLLKTLFKQLKIKSSRKQDFIFLNTGLIMVLLHNVTESSMLRGLSTLSVFLLFIIVSTSLLPSEPENNAKEA